MQTAVGHHMDSAPGPWAGIELRLWCTHPPARLTLGMASMTKETNISQDGLPRTSGSETVRWEVVETAGALLPCIEHRGLICHRCQHYMVLESVILLVGLWRYSPLGVRVVINVL